MTTNAMFVMDNTKKTLGGQLEGAGARAFPSDLKPRLIAAIRGRKSLAGRYPSVGSFEEKQLRQGGTQ